ncbi:putative solute-binding protein, partial [Salmonella enterica]|uniref:putative solute-binding protein n=1 Tax=Salmonella enterica TaxID=28901 RepID=UPI003FA6BA8A
LILSAQLVINPSKFPAGFGQKSREYWASQFDRAKKAIDSAEASIPGETWMDLSTQDGSKYTLMLRESRIDIAKQGLYNKTGLKVLKKVRCSVNGSDAECATKSEEEWQ